MARIQILELPTIYRDEGPDETPFVLVVDQASESTIAALGMTPEPDGPVSPMDAARRALSQTVAEQIGARAVLVFEETIDIPANWVHTDDDGVAGTVRIKVEPDLDGFSEQVQAAVTDANQRLSAALKSPAPAE